MFYFLDNDKEKIINLIMHYSFKSTPTWTLKSRTQTVTKANQISSNPGPADYQVKKPLPQSATIASTKQQRNLYKAFQANPGPGTYQTKSYISDGPKRTMSAKSISYCKKTPGPHDYDNDTLKVKQKAPGFSMSTKSKSYKQMQFEKNSYKPAPSSYESKTTFEKKNGIFIGSSKRKDLTETQQTPAPNYYNKQKADMYASTMNPRCKMGGEIRKTTDFMNGQSTPGPAYYEKSNLFSENKQKKRGYTCRQKNSDLIALELSKFPGPGQYESPLKNKSQAPRQALTKTERRTFMDDMQTNKKEYPGPAQYESKLSGTKYRAQSAFVFKRATRQPLDENEKTPGPVQYQNNKIEVLYRNPSFSVGKTVPKNEFLQVKNPQEPGPGQYDPNANFVKESSKSFQTSKQKRPSFDKHRYTPGPGFYNLRGKQSGPTWKFSSYKRIAFTDKKNQGKGGIQYDIPQKVVDPPKYMNVESKVKFDGKAYGSTMNTIQKKRGKKQF